MCPDFVNAWGKPKIGVSILEVCGVLLQCLGLGWAGDGGGKGMILCLIRNPFPTPNKEASL